MTENKANSKNISICIFCLLHKKIIFNEANQKPASCKHNDCILCTAFTQSQFAFTCKEHQERAI